MFIFIDLGYWLILLTTITAVIVSCRKIKHNKILWGLLLVSSLAIVGIIGYGSSYEQMNIITRFETIDIEDYEKQPINIVLASDLHVGRYLNSIKVPLLVRKINNVKNSDIVLILGDVVNDKSYYLNHLDKLKDIEEDTYFIFGNHDYRNCQVPIHEVSGLQEKMESLQITTLRNELIEIQKGIYLYGIKDLWSEEEDFSELKNVDTSDTVILLSHDPDGILALENSGYMDKVDLMVSGHTHGGEIRLPVVGSIYPIPIELPEEFEQGLTDYKEIPVFVTSGVGSAGIRMRLFNPAEIAVLTIE
jgi:predicted MPP superfamily phosphohydrolase